MYTSLSEFMAENSEYDPMWAVNLVSCHDGKCGSPDYIPKSLGEGVYVYLIDTGAYRHADFGDRLQDPIVLVDDGDPTDYIKHGTATSGLVGSSSYGIAKKSLIVPVKAFDKSGYSSTELIANAIAEVVKHKKNSGTTELSVLNMSLLYGSSKSLDSLVRRLPKLSIIPVAAAGNFADDSSYYSPANNPSAVTVGSIGYNQKEGVVYISDFSNYGPYLNMFAPGESVTSTCPDDEYCVVSGTSFSAPIVSGCVAVAISENPGLTPDALRTVIMDATRKDILHMDNEKLSEGYYNSTYSESPTYISSTDVPNQLHI